MAHHGHAVQRWLTVEEHRVTVEEVTVHHVTLVQLDGLRVHVLERNHAAIRALDGLRTRIRVRAVLHKGVQAVDVERGGALREGEVHSDLHRHTELLYGDVGVRCNDGTGGELHALTLQVVTDAALLRAETLLEGLQGATRALGRLGHAWDFVVDERGDVVLYDRSPLIDGLLLGTLRD